MTVNLVLGVGGQLVLQKMNAEGSKEAMTEHENVSKRLANATGHCVPKTKHCTRIVGNAPPQNVNQSMENGGNGRDGQNVADNVAMAKEVGPRVAIIQHQSMRDCPVQWILFRLDPSKLPMKKNTATLSHVPVIKLGSLICIAYVYHPLYSAFYILVGLYRHF